MPLRGKVQNFVSSYTDRWQMVLGILFVVFVMFVRGGFIGMWPLQAELSALPPTTKRTLQRAYGRFPWLTATAQMANRRDSGALEGNRTTTPVGRPSPPSRPGCRSPR